MEVIVKHLILVSIVLGLAGCKPASEVTPKAVPKKEHKIVVYYLCNTFRCEACNGLESMVKAAALGGKAENGQTKVTTDVTSPYPDLVTSGKLVFKSVNVDEELNKHLLTDFDTDSKLPVIAEIKDGKVLRFKIMKNVWKLLDDDKAFIAYIQDGLKEYADPMSKAKK